MKNIVITLCLLHHFSHGAAYDCSWFVDCVTWNRPLEESTIVGNTVERINITDVIRDVDIPNLLQNPPKDGFHSFPYYLRARVACGEELEISVERGRSFALTGTKPVFIVSVKKDDDTTCSVVTQLRMEGLLVDQSNGTDENCTSTICYPIWLAPLPVVVDTLRMPITVETEGLGYDESFTARQVIHVDGYIEQSDSQPAALVYGLGEKADFNELTDVLSANKSYPNKFILNLSPVEVIGGFGNNFLLYSSDDFLNMTLLKVTLPNTPKVCSDTDYSSPDEIFDAVALTDCILMSTTVGLVQVVGKFLSSVLKFSQVAPWNLRVIFSEGCVKEIIIPKQHIPKFHFVILVTVDHKVYVNDQLGGHTNQTIDLTFTEIGGEDGGVCSFTGDSYCHVISVDMLPFGFLSCLILIETGETPQTDTYKLLHYEDGNFTVLYTIPKNVMTNATYSQHVLLTESKRINLEEPAISKKVQIKKLSTPAHISSEVYLWGSHLIQSFDAGKTFIIMSSYKSDGDIILFTSSLDGYFIILNDEQEIWGGVMGSRSVSKIYPSLAWSLYILTNAHELLGKDFKMISLFFDTDNKINQLISFENNVGNITILHRKVPGIEMLNSVAFEGVVLKEPWEMSDGNVSKSGLNSRENDCPFHKLAVSMPQNIKELVAQELFRFGPPRQFQGYGQNAGALKGAMAHQAVTELLFKKEQARDRMYSDGFNSRTARWKSERGLQSTDGAYTEYRFTNGLMRDGIHLDTNEYAKEFAPQNDQLIHLPDLIYLDQNMTCNFTIELHLSSDTHNVHMHESDEIDIHNVEDLHISMEVVNSSLLTTHMKRTEVYQLEKAVYELSVSPSTSLNMQTLPGSGFLTACVHLHVKDSDAKCLEEVNGGKEVRSVGSHKMSVHLGCPPNYDLMFDSFAALNATRNSGLGEYPWDCVEVDPDFPCFYYGNVFYPFFKIVDKASGNSWRFEGNYTLIVVGGKAVDEDVYEQYSAEEILVYNQEKFQTGQTQIWMPFNETYVNENGWFVFSHLNNAITWTCLVNSPCAFIFPKRIGDAPEYFFELEFSNIDVVSSTFCAFRKRFKVHVHGMPMNMTIMPLYIVGATTSILVLYIFIYWLCHRSNHAGYNKMMAIFSKIASAIKPKKTEELPEYLSKMSLAAGSSLFEEAEQELCETLADLDQTTSEMERLSIQVNKPPSFPPVGGSSRMVYDKESLSKMQEELASFDLLGESDEEENGRYMRTEV